jgi:hypothetical protein
MRTHLFLLLLVIFAGHGPCFLQGASAFAEGPTEYIQV